ncbi:MAG TPA: histidine kinase [Gemmatimonadaceae bacterium]|nr:histidine kinase [Gemmatimonadaceae bacterium]
MSARRSREFALFSGWRGWAAGFAFWTAFGALQFMYRYTDVLARGGTQPIHEKLIEELTGAWGAGLLAPLVFQLARRLRERPPLWVLHLPAVVAYSALHTSWNWATRTAAFRALGYGAYDYGIMHLRYVMEFPIDIIGYGFFTVFVLLFDHYRAALEREVRVAELESEISQVRLEALEAQLQPHFLFNALNTISSVMYESVEQADRMLVRLSDLLRRTLDSRAGGEVTLAEELETLEIYLDIMRARFGDRLDITVEREPEVAQARVPHLVLQPLVENALKHGDPGPGVRAHVHVRAGRQDGHLVLTVCDNGPGLSVDEASVFARGVGLANTRRRLERLYGASGDLALGRAPTGGLRVTLRVPYRG